VKTVIFIARARGKAPEQRNQMSVRHLLLGGDLTGTIKTVCPKSFLEQSVLSFLRKGLKPNGRDPRLGERSEESPSRRPHVAKR